MKNQYEYLQDSIFLKELAEQHIKQFFAKITVLNWNEDPIANIESRVMTANLTIDGNSIIRRAASLSVLIEGLINNIYNIESLLSLNKKIFLQIGYLNNTQKYQNYPILWFPFGTMVIISSNITNSNTGLIASLQLKDKMCLLNGECGGVIPASTVFDNYITVNSHGEQLIVRPTIYQIIKELVNHFGGEQLSKIIVADLDTRVKQAMKWTGNSPLYFLNKSDQYFMTIETEEYLTKMQQGWMQIEGSPFEYGQDVGYILIDFTFPGDLIGDAGATVVDILEKIKAVLGNYEYFYDTDGNFVWQEIKNFLNNSQSEYIRRSFQTENRTFIPDYINSETNSSLAAYIIDQSNGTSVFSFNDSNLISSYNNSIQHTLIKNDFVVWGIRITTDGYKIPIRYHLAIDKKPIPGNTYQAIAYIDLEDGIEKWHVPLKFDSRDDFPTEGTVGMFYMDNSNNNIYTWIANNVTYGYEIVDVQLESITTSDWRTELYFQGVMAEPYGVESNYYYTELITEWPKLYDIRNGKIKDQVAKNPSGIDFYLDLIDIDTEVAEFSVDNIGRRSLVLNENENVNCVFQPWIPDIIIINKDYSGQDQSTQPSQLRKECEDRNQNYYQASGQIYDNLAVGGILNSGYQVIRQMIHESTSFNNSISLQTIPLFHLEPNTRITVNDAKSHIFGDYIINRLSFNIDTSSALTINATQALEKI